MKNINNFDEYVNETYIGNLSKKRKFPNFEDTGKKVHPSNIKLSDVYSMYELSKKELGKYLNTWFVGEVHIAKNGDCYRDEMWTFKKCDEETARVLYGRKINPISITIMCPTGAKFKFNDKGEKLYEMKAHIWSIDDSQYGIWFYNKTFEELEQIRLKLMQWLNSYVGNFKVDGEEFLERCISLGADPESKDYN